MTKKKLVRRIDLYLEKYPSDTMLGDPGYQCYRLSGHEYDESGHCKICFNPGINTYQKKRQNSAIYDLLKDIKELLK